VPSGAGASFQLILKAVSVDLAGFGEHSGRLEKEISRARIQGNVSF
jgi:hypothetical protein